MTLKTTKELTADSLWAKSVGVYYGSSQIGAPIFTGITKERFDEVVRPAIEDLCHDADRAGELEMDIQSLTKRAWKAEDEVEDLRAKLDEAQKDAERYRIIRHLWPMPFWVEYGGSVHDADGCDRAVDRALKEQEKI